MKNKSLVFFSLLLIGMGLSMQGCIKEADDPTAPLKADAAIIDAYLQKNNITGILYDAAFFFRLRLPDPGEGIPAHRGDVVKGTYTAQILSPDGFVGPPFDEGPLDKKIEEITPGALAYLAGILLEGGTGTIYSPSLYGFGKTGNGALGVPPNSIVVYTLHVSEVDKTPAWDTQAELDATKLATYMEEKEIDATLDEATGIWYKIEAPGEGSTFCTPYSYIDLDYEVQTLLASGPGGIVDQGVIDNVSVWSLIDGLKVGLPMLKAGGKATFYIPSGLAYGDATKEGIPKNSNLVFKVRSLKTIRN